MLKFGKSKKHQYDSVSRFFEACTFVARFFGVCPFYERKSSKWSYIRHVPALFIGPFLSFLFVQCLPPHEENDGTTRTLFALQLSESVIVGHSYLICFAVLNSRIGRLRSAIVGIGATGAILPSPTPVYDIVPFVVYDLVLLAAAVWFHVFFLYDENKVGIIDHILTFSYTTPFILLHLLTSPLRTLLVIATVQARSLKVALTNPPPLTFAGKYYAETLCRVQWRIGAAVTNLSDAYSFHMFFSTSLFFLIAVYNLYDILTFNLQADGTNNMGSNISGVIWIGFWGVDVVCLAYLAESLAEQFEEFNVKLHGLIVEDIKGIYSDSMKLLLQIAMQSTPQLSAGGFFIINYGLLLSMTSSAATYLIILIQFAQLKIVNDESDESVTTAATSILQNSTLPTTSLFNCTSAESSNFNQSPSVL